MRRLRARFDWPDVDEGEWHELGCSLNRMSGAAWVVLDGINGHDGETMGFDLFDLLDALGVEIGLVSSASGSSRLVRRP